MTLAKRLLARAGLPTFSVGASPSSVSGTSTSSTVTSSTATASASGGSGSRTYAWARVSGSTSINANSSTSAATTFSASMSVGTISAVFACTVTDTVTTQVLTTNTVTVTLTRESVPPPPLSLNVPNGSQTGNSSSTINVTAGTTASASGGSGSYTSYSWPDISGFTKSPSGNVCYYGASLGPGQSKAGSGTCTVTDSSGNTASDGFSITCENTGTPLPAFSVSASPSGVGGSALDGNVTTNATTASAIGAVGGVSWSWTRTSGVGNVAASSSASTVFTRYVAAPGTEYGSFRVTGTDSATPPRTATADVSAAFTHSDIS